MLKNLSFRSYGVGDTHSNNLRGICIQIMKICFKIKTHNNLRKNTTFNLYFIKNFIFLLSFSIFLMNSSLQFVVLPHIVYGDCRTLMSQKGRKYTGMHRNKENFYLNIFFTTAKQTFNEGTQWKKILYPQFSHKI